MGVRVDIVVITKELMKLAVRRAVNDSDDEDEI